MVGAGAKRKIKFEIGECKRAFRNAVICKTLIPTVQPPSLIDLLDALEPYLYADFRSLNKEHHALKSWVALPIEYEIPEIGRYHRACNRNSEYVYFKRV